MRSRTPQVERSPHVPQLENVHQQQQSPSAAKKQNNLYGNCSFSVHPNPWSQVRLLAQGSCECTCSPWLTHSELQTTDPQPGFCEASSCLLGPPTTYIHPFSVSFVISSSPSPLWMEITPNLSIALLQSSSTHSLMISPIPMDLTIFSVQTAPRSTTQPWHLALASV